MSTDPALERMVLWYVWYNVLIARFFDGKQWFSGKDIGPDTAIIGVNWNYLLQLNCTQQQWQRIHQSGATSRICEVFFN